MWNYWKTNRQLRAELAESKQIALMYQRDWHRMMNLVQSMDRLLELEQDLVKKLSKKKGHRQ